MRPGSWIWPGVALSLWLTSSAAGAELELKRPRILSSASPTIGGRILVVGGLTDSGSLLSMLGDAEIIEPAADGRVLGPIPLAGKLMPARAGHAVALLAGGRVLVAGGDAIGTAELYDPDCGVLGGFVKVGRLPGGPRLHLTATTLGDGRVLIAGGFTVSKRSSLATELFDPEQAQLAAGPPLSRPRAAHAAVLLADGRVLLIGGVGENTTEIFDPVENRFLPGPAMCVARDDHRATRLADGRVLVTGGQDARGRTVSSAELYDPRTGKLARAGDLEVDRADHAQVLLPDGRVLVLGGERDDGRNHDTVLAAVECFDPTTGTFSRCRPLAEPRDEPLAVLLEDGRVLVMGGQGPGDAGLRSIEFYEVERAGAATR